MSKSSSNIQPTSTPERKKNRRFYSTKTFRLLSMLTLTFTYFIVELVVGNVTNSLALVADAFHMLSDVIALLIGLLAVRMSRRQSDINTYGWARGEVVGANVNTVFLLALCLTIVFDVIKRYITPEPIDNPTLLLIVGSIGLGINIIGLFLFQGFHGHSHGSKNDSHNHSHDGGHDSHAYSHDDEEDAHQHGTNHKQKPKTKKIGSDNGERGLELGVIHPKNHQADQKTFVSIEINDTEQIEHMPGPGEFKRHSIRALEEIIADCAAESHDHSHGHSHDSTSSDIPASSTAANADNIVKKKSKAPSMNMHGVFLHVLADALGSVVVIISALIIKFVPHDPNNLKHWTVYIDPTLSLIIVIIITASAIPLFKETSFILLQTMPKHVKVDVLKKQLIEEVPEVDNIHELHIWRLTGEKFIASAHVKRRSLTDYMSVADKVKHFFHSMGIHSTTIQYEYDNDDTQNLVLNNSNDNTTISNVSGKCLLRCANDTCDTLACCAKDLIDLDTTTNTNNNDSTKQRSTIIPIETRTNQTDEQNHEHTSHNRVSTTESSYDEKL